MRAGARLLTAFFLVVIALFLSGAAMPDAVSQVYVAKTGDRIKGLETLWHYIKLPDLTGKKVAIKANFNSDDPFPATTHLDTLEFVIKKLKAAGAASITIAERSGMGDTAKILKDRGVEALADRSGVRIINLDKVSAESWKPVRNRGDHWRSGFLASKVFLDADFVVDICCLKTHRFGGDFSMSLKNNVGAIAKWGPGPPPYNYMLELHSSPAQRLMIAEVNRAIPCGLAIMDAMKGFADMGPDRGKLIEPGLLMASADRVALDAAGVAVLRFFGTTKKVSEGNIFALDQIRRAGELGVGVASPDRIEPVAVNKEASDTVRLIRSEFRSFGTSAPRR
ncbi:MAG TPA: DUF362 domain-containing protein [Candidatus Omnitrophota bacterium]|nr:DUF362 domain-containing protein [Candidatus Omnitrophota bacterium]